MKKGSKIQPKNKIVKKALPKKNVKKPVKKTVKQPVKKVVKKQNMVHSYKKDIKKKKIRRLRVGRIFLCLILFFLFIYLVANFLKVPIKNIFIYNNTTLSDQEIIDIAGISNYPSILGFTCNGLEKKLEKNIYIKEASVVKKFREIHITIDENYGLFYNKTTNKTILKDKKEISEELNAPILVNYVTDDIYPLFIEKMLSVKKNIIDRISEIKYDPNSVDSERFIFTMSDGNYVYMTLEKFDSINGYVDIIKSFGNKKGILYLDSGEYFKIFEN